MAETPPEQIARFIVDPANLAPDRARLVVTPNLQHVVLMHEDPRFRAAVDYADIVTPDGFPVLKYAQLRGYRGHGRITGHDLFFNLLPLMADFGQHLFLVVDSEQTQEGFKAHWADMGLDPARLHFDIPPFGFENDPAYCAELAGRIAGSKARLLIMGVGPPKSEVFVHQHCNELPACWALCIGSAVNVFAGTGLRAPDFYQRHNLEWFYRVLKEPRRLIKRYFWDSRKFLPLVLKDLRQRGRGGAPGA